MDIYHKIMEVARRHKLHEAPISPHSTDPPRILDLGCGTGIWAIDMAEYVATISSTHFIGSRLTSLSPANTKTQKYALDSSPYRALWLMKISRLSDSTS